MKEQVKAAPHAQVVKSDFNLALIGNPNSGKTTIFNALTGLRQKVGNYPGVTVEKKTGLIESSGGYSIRAHDLPGLYSLVPKSLDDKIASDIITGRASEIEHLDVVVVVIDASSLERNLYLATQVVEMGMPVIVALNMMDAAESAGIAIDSEKLARQIGAIVVPVVANKGTGIAVLRQEIFKIVEGRSLREPKGIRPPAEIKSALKPVRDWLAANSELSEMAIRFAAVRILSSDKALGCWRNPANGHVHDDYDDLVTRVQEARQELDEQGVSWSMLETQLRYQWIDTIYATTVCKTREHELNRSEKADRILTHRILGPIIFLLIFGAIFQSIFAWAEIPMRAIESGVAWFGSVIAGVMPDGVLQDLIVDGAIAGVGAILVFLPQILFLFFFLSLLEDSGYLARAAFIMDRTMRSVGLSGRSVIPLLSSFACAIPGIMATRTIRNSSDRIITIMIAPLMSCSARLPVYALMIGAFIPGVVVMGIFKLPGLILLAMYLFGIVAAIAAALVMKRFVGRNEPPSTFVMVLPAYRRPSMRSTLIQVWERAKIFVTDAGKIILAISIVLWFLAYYPRPQAEMSSSQAINQSYAGQLGHAIEPAIRPLGFDWKMGIGLITSFAAREVMVSTLATIYNVEGADESSVTLRQALINDRDPKTGKPVYTPLTAVSLMVFFALACQCMSTVAVVKRETNSWHWPLIMVVYMTVLAYTASLVVFQGGKLLGFG
ncbi:MAG: ferrous iron transport protein B [Calditrichaeota bacterium]|nr:ferrous iron transport protein B [Calditrichota bacterium]